MILRAFIILMWLACIAAAIAALVNLELVAALFWGIVVVGSFYLDRKGRKEAK